MASVRVADFVLKNALKRQLYSRRPILAFTRPQALRLILKNAISVIFAKQPVLIRLSGQKKQERKTMWDLKSLILAGGYFGIFFIVFAESGLLFGFFFPGDSLLLTAGLLASQGYLEIKTLIFLAITAAIAGDTVGYWFGKKVGPKIFKREDSLFFHKKNIIRANQFYKKHGGKTIVLARFLPFVRTFAPIVAGVGEMNYPRFLSFNIFGGIFWVLTTSLAGYYLGRSVPNVEKYFLFIVLAVIIISATPGIIHFWRDYRKPMWRMLRDKFGI